LTSRSYTGRIAEQMGDLDHAQSAYDSALRHNPASLPGLTQVASIARIKENYPIVSVFSNIVMVGVFLFAIASMAYNPAREQTTKKRRQRWLQGHVSSALSP
jgi:hypothetical protein